MSESLLAQSLEQVGQTVRSDVTFSPKYYIDEHPSQGNCYEFALRTHAKLEKVGATDYVGYSYDHAFNIGLFGDRPYLLSSDMPGLSVHSPVQSMFNTDIESDMRQGTITGFAVGTLCLKAVGNNIAPEDIDTINKNRAWFSKYWLQADAPAVTFMESGYAREALTNYGEFRKGLWQKDFEQIRAGLASLAIRTPQYETRPKYNEELRDFKRAIRVFSRVRGLSTADLLSLTEQYREVLPEKNAAANIVFGDCCRDVAQAHKNPRAIEQAKRYYQESKLHSWLRRKRENPLVEAKLSKVESMAI